MILTSFEKALSSKLSKQLGFKVYAYHEGFWIIETDFTHPGMGASISEAVEEIKFNFGRVAQW